MNRALVVVVAGAFALPAMTLAAEESRTGPLRYDGAAERYQYQEVVHVEGIGSEELYSRARSWLANAYKSAKDVIQLEDENRRLIAKGNTQTPFLGLQTVTVHHTLTIEVKDGRYRYTITDFIYDTGDWSAPMESSKVKGPGVKGVKTRTAETIESVIESLRDTMAKSSTVGDDDW